MDVFGEPMAGRNQVLLNATWTWSPAIHAAAAALPNVRIEHAATPLEAVRLLASCENRFSHLLLEPGFAGEMLSVLVDLTSGEPGSETSLILLGETAVRPAHASPSRTQIIRSPHRGWLARALAADMAVDHSAPSVDELRDALAAARIGTRYQPIVRMSDRAPIGLEVLARFDHPERGTLAPDLFVPHFEAAGLAWPFTETVVRRAFQDWGQGHLADLGLTLALNFPLDVLLIPSALSWLETQREMAGMPATSIMIELTESRPLVELAGLGQAISRLRTLGYELAIDDVGPSVRDHRPLFELPFTALKLDKELVRLPPASNAANDFLLRAIDAARGAGMRVIAEGVQDVAIWDRMAALGVDQAQGFLVGRPLPAEAVPLWLHDWRGRYGA